MTAEVEKPTRAEGSSREAGCLAERGPLGPLQEGGLRVGVCPVRAGLPKSPARREPCCPQCGPPTPPLPRCHSTPTQPIPGGSTAVRQPPGPLWAPPNTPKSMSPGPPGWKGGPCPCVGKCRGSEPAVASSDSWGGRTWTCPPPLQGCAPQTTSPPGRTSPPDPGQKPPRQQGGAECRPQSVRTGEAMCPQPQGHRAVNLDK